MKPLCPYCDEPISPTNKKKYDELRNSNYCEACEERYFEEVEEEENFHCYNIRS
jgi:hypothetical protein